MIAGNASRSDRAGDVSEAVNPGPVPSPPRHRANGAQPSSMLGLLVDGLTGLAAAWVGAVLHAVGLVTAAIHRNHKS